MNRSLNTFVAVLSALIVGLVGYAWYKDSEVMQDQDYRSAAHLSQSMAIMSPMKSVTDMVWQMTGELPCSADDYAAAGFRPPGHNPTSSAPWVSVTGCGEFAVIFSEFDGTPPGKIVMKATRNPNNSGPYFSWSCTSPNYKSIGDYFPWCRYVEG